MWKPMKNRDFWQSILIFVVANVRKEIIALFLKREKLPRVRLFDGSEKEQRRSDLHDWQS